ncbi:MAG: cupin domain-containing protein, partial [Candidatus Binatia bacterium]
PMPFGEGDLITNPHLTFHGHVNQSDTPVMWLDGLDVRLVGYLGAQFQQNYVKEQQPIEKPDGYSARVLGRARPSWLKTTHATPPFRYQWKETHSTLSALKESDGDPFDGILLEYANPFTGGSTLPTYSCEIQLLRPMEKTRSHRHTSTVVYQAFRGQGTATIDGQRFDWEQGDIFVVPPWHAHNHENRANEDSMLFSITDRPSAAALGLYREEPVET